MEKVIRLINEKDHEDKVNANSLYAAVFGFVFGIIVTCLAIAYYHSLVGG